MTGKISLTASMRSNLLSLQNISRQVSSTQNKLATGNKVNSAIDNPSSYYTARALNNRADDLNALLDSMGQAISTIKAATTALETGASFLEQAAAVATQALETTSIPAKSYFEEKVGENGAVVATAQELRDAIANGKETICVYGKIDLGDISDIGNLQLKDNQRLVGVGYFGNFDTKTEKFSQIIAETSVANRGLITTGNNSIISDLTLKFKNTIEQGFSMAVTVSGNWAAVLNNLEIIADFSDDPSNGMGRGAICASAGAVVDQQGDINIKTSGKIGWGVYASQNSKINVQSDAEVNINTTGKDGAGFSTYGKSQLNVAASAKVNIETRGEGAYGIRNQDSSIVDIAGDLSVKILNKNSQGLYVRGAALFNLSGKVNIQTADQTDYGIFFESGSFAGNTVNIMSSAQISIEANSDFIWLQSHDPSVAANTLLIEQGAAINFKNSTTQTENYFKAAKEYQNANDGRSVFITPETLINDKDHFAETGGSWPQPEAESAADKAGSHVLVNSSDYQQIMNQYDSLIKDASYKGINLLQNDKLGVNFNEIRNASLNVQGKDMSSRQLGLITLEWQTLDDVAQSLSEISSALKSLRNFSAELGNNYSIITTRQDFTENLINILTEGADKLTLADMNEESANMLALQTRQQLAVNSLSLASQASQSVLRLF